MIDLYTLYSVAGISYIERKRFSHNNYTGRDFINLIIGSKAFQFKNCFEMKVYVINVKQQSDCLFKMLN